MSEKVELSKYQKAIIEEFKHGKGNMLINALAGTGKTFILTEMSKLINNYSCFVAFNKSIQEEIKTRISNPKFKVFTSNGLGYSIMQANWRKMEDERLKQNIAPSYKRELNLQQYKSNNNAALLYKQFSKSLGFHFTEEEKELSFIRDLAQLYDLCRYKLINMQDENAIDNVIVEYKLFSETNTSDHIQFLIEKMLELDKNQFFKDGIVDFTDQLYITYIMIASGQWELEYWQRFYNILVDEAQDLSRLQQFFLGCLRRSSSTRYVFVGDKNQSIYEFLGADCHSIDNIKKIYKPKEFDLPINYRCPVRHLRKVNVEFNIPIQPRPNAPQGEILSIEYNDIVDLIKKGDVILSRRNKDLFEILLILLKNGHPAYIRDQALVQKLIQKIVVLSTQIKHLSEIPDIIQTLKTEQQERIKERNKKFLEGGTIENDSVNDTVNENEDNIFEDDSVIELLDCILVVYLSFCEYYAEEPDKIDDFNRFLTYVKSKLQNNEKKDSIQCVSIHQAKGQEYNRVFILNNAKVFSEYGRTLDQMQQEKNLSYIALTRSKQTLFLVSEPDKDKPIKRKDTEESDDEITSKLEQEGILDFLF